MILRQVSALCLLQWHGVSLSFNVFSGNKKNMMVHFINVTYNVFWEIQSSLKIK